MSSKIACKGVDHTRHGSDICDCSVWKYTPLHYFVYCVLSSAFCMIHTGVTSNVAKAATTVPRHVSCFPCCLLAFYTVRNYAFITLRSYDVYSSLPRPHHGHSRGRGIYPSPPSSSTPVSGEAVASPQKRRTTCACLPSGSHPLASPAHRAPLMAASW